MLCIITIAVNKFMMTSSYGNIFRDTGSSPVTVTRSFDVFIFAPEQMVE